MGPITSLTGQQTVAPLTKQLRNDEQNEVGTTDRDDSNAKRVAVSQPTPPRVETTKGAESRNLLAQSTTANENQPSTNTPRGSLLDISV